jgi:hypothetical protein
MKRNGLARSADVFAESALPETASAESTHTRPLGGRRISFVAWGLAGVAGIAIWALIIRLA